MIKIGMNGALGRMGVRILTLAYQSKDFKIAGCFEHAKSEALGKDAGPALGFGENIQVKISEISAASIKPCDVVIDFSGPEGTRLCLQAALKNGTGLVIGTTGLGKEIEAEIKAASKTIPILFSPNMSIGANFLFELARIAAEQLNAGYDIEITEAHHRLKKDAPSGTAKKIAEVIAKAKGWDLSKVAKYGREGVTGERPKDQLGIHVVRAGDIVGDHTILFSGSGESIELTHRAQSRDAFARGSLAAALFVSKKKSGLFSMTDVLKGGA